MPDLSASLKMSILVIKLFWNSLRASGESEWAYGESLNAASYSVAVTFMLSIFMAAGSLLLAWLEHPHKRHIDKILDIVSDLYLNPLFDAKEMEKERQDALEMGKEKAQTLKTQN